MTEHTDIFTVIIGLGALLFLGGGLLYLALRGIAVWEDKIAPRLAGRRRTGGEQ